MDGRGGRAPAGSARQPRVHYVRAVVETLTHLRRYGTLLRSWQKGQAPEVLNQVCSTAKPSHLRSKALYALLVDSAFKQANKCAMVLQDPL